MTVLGSTGRWPLATAIVFLSVYWAAAGPTTHHEASPAGIPGGHTAVTDHPATTQPAGDWTFDRGLYTNDPKTGQRTIQYERDRPAYRDPYAVFDSPHESFPFSPDPGYGEYPYYEGHWPCVLGAYPYYEGLWPYYDGYWGDGPYGW